MKITCTMYHSRFFIVKHLNIWRVTEDILKCHLHSFSFQMKFYFQTYEEFFKENMPTLFRHFSKTNVTPDIYLIDWYVQVYKGHHVLFLKKECFVTTKIYHEWIPSIINIIRLFSLVVLNKIYKNYMYKRTTW